MHKAIFTTAPWLFAVLSACLYLYLGYGIQRQETVSVFICWFALFIFAYSLYQSSLHTKTLLAIGIGFRILFILSLPALSDDYFRFIWDGRLLANGINPFNYTPAQILSEPLLMQQAGLTQALYQKLNSPEYFTVYPPVAQLSFALSAYFSPAQSNLWHVIGMRMSIFLAEFITIFLGQKILAQWSLDAQKIILYVLNPLIIIEFSGNLHFEAWMIAGLAICLYYWKRGQLAKSALGLGIAVLAKLLPLMLFPLFLRPLWFKNAFIFYGSAFLVIIAAFSPLMHVQHALHVFSSVRLYFIDFEFNASIYYLVREIGYWVMGYNIIATAGKILPAVVLLTILGISFLGKKGLPHSMLLIFFMYLLGAHIVHPWYIGVLVFLSMFTGHTFPWVWSCMIVLSYATYRTNAYIEDLRLVALEYVIVLIALFIDWRRLNASRIVDSGSTSIP